MARSMSARPLFAVPVFLVSACVAALGVVFPIGSCMLFCVVPPIARRSLANALYRASLFAARALRNVFQGSVRPVPRQQSSLTRRFQELSSAAWRARRSVRCRCDAGAMSGAISNGIAYGFRALIRM